MIKIKNINKDKAGDVKSENRIAWIFLAVGVPLWIGGLVFGAMKINEDAPLPYIFFLMFIAGFDILVAAISHLLEIKFPEKTKPKFFTMARKVWFGLSILTVIAILVFVKIFHY